MNKPQLIDLHCVRLCFHALGKTTDSAHYNTVVGFAVSEEILDKKSHNLLNRIGHAELH